MKNDDALLTQLQTTGRCKIFYDYSTFTEFNVSSENLAIAAYIHAMYLCEQLGIENWSYDANQFSLTVIVDE